LPFAGGGLAGGGLAGAAPLSDGAAGGGAPLLGLAIAPELSDGGVVAGALLWLAGGGLAAGSVLGDSFFAQAVSSNAAASALRATLVFIDRYPDALLERANTRALRTTFLSFRESFTGRAPEFYRVTVRF
jgi:hypothetical protein